jgi:hypothetical protein
MKHLGIALIAAGAVIWTAGAAAWMSGVWVTLPPDTVRILVLSLAGVTGGLLLGAGALIGRTGRKGILHISALRDAPHAPPQLAEPEDSPSDLRARQVAIDQRVP